MAAGRSRCRKCTWGLWRNPWSSCGTQTSCCHGTSGTEWRQSPHRSGTSGDAGPSRKWTVVQFTPLPGKATSLFPKMTSRCGCSSLEENDFSVKNSPQFLSEGLEALRTRSCSVFSQHPVKQIQKQIRFRSLLKIRFSLDHVQRSLERTSWPRGSGHQWTPLVKKEALPRACSAPPPPSRIHSPGRCSSPQTSPCGSGRSSGPAHSAQRSSSPRGNWWCRSRSARTQEITPSEREEKAMNTRFFKCVLIQDMKSDINLEIRWSEQRYQYLCLFIHTGNFPCLKSMSCQEM